MHLVAAVVVAGALGLGLLVLQRWVAETRLAAMILVAAWFVVVGVATALAVRPRPHLRAAAMGTFIVIVLASVGVGYWTAFRDRHVQERVVMASRAASGAELEAGLAGMPLAQPPTAPARLASGLLSGADGHTAAGKVAVVREPSGDRRITLTDFEADPGPMVVVYLARDERDVGDVIELGGLKGNVGNQQYRIPAGADLRAYDTLILWCVPFTTRIAVAPLV